MQVRQVAREQCERVGEGTFVAGYTGLETADSLAHSVAMGKT